MKFIFAFSSLKINMNKPISYSPFCTPLGIVANISALHLLLWCCYEVNIGISSSAISEALVTMYRNRGIVPVVLQFTRLLIISLLLG